MLSGMGREDVDVWVMYQPTPAVYEQAKIPQKTTEVKVLEREVLYCSRDRLHASTTRRSQVVFYFARK